LISDSEKPELVLSICEKVVVDNCAFCNDDVPSNQFIQSSKTLSISASVFAVAKASSIVIKLLINQSISDCNIALSDSKSVLDFSNTITSEEAEEISNSKVDILLSIQDF